MTFILMVWDWLKSPLGKQIALWGSLVALLLGFGQWRYHDGVQHEQRAEAARVEAAKLIAAGKEAKAAKDTDHTQTVVTEKQAEIHTVTKTLTEKVRVYVKQDPSRASLPVGFVRLHDAAILGVPDLADAAGRPDGQPSGITDPQLLTVDIENAGACRANAAALIGWQDWYAKLQHNFNAKP